MSDDDREDAVRAEMAVDAAEEKLAAAVAWLETNQPDVFRRGLWDAVRPSSGVICAQCKRLVTVVTIVHEIFPGARFCSVGCRDAAVSRYQPPPPGSPREKEERCSGFLCGFRNVPHTVEQCPDRARSKYAAAARQRLAEMEAERDEVWKAYHGADHERCELRAECSKQRGLANHAEHRAHVFADDCSRLRAALAEVTAILGSALGLTDKHAEAVERARAVLANQVPR